MSINLKRREFLLGAAKLGLSLPTMQMLLQCENALGETTSAHPDSMVLMYISNGNRISTFEPTAVFTHKNFSILAPNVRRASLSELLQPDGSLSPVISNSFNPNHIGMIRGIDWGGTDESGGGEHNPGAIATGSSSQVLKAEPNPDKLTFYFPTEPSIDQIINPHLGNTTMGVIAAMAGPSNQGGGYPNWSYKRGAGNSVYGINSEHRPDILYNNIVGNIATDPALVQKLKNKRISVANLIHEQFTRTLSSGKKVLSKKDKTFLEQHLALIQQQQKKINSLTTNACTVTAPPTLIESNGDWAHAQVFNRLKAQIDNWILARLCGLSKVLVLHVPETDPLDIGSGGNHHGISHDREPGKTTAKKLPIEKGYMEVFAYLVNRLDSTYDPDGKTLLQKTLCVFNNSAGTLGDEPPESHYPFNYPIVVASRHPSIKAIGYWLDYHNHKIDKYTKVSGGPFVTGYKLGVQLNRFHVTLAKAMGLTPEQYLSPLTGTIGAHQNNNFNQYDDAKINVPLEGFL